MRKGCKRSGNGQKSRRPLNMRRGCFKGIRKRCYHRVDAPEPSKKNAMVFHMTEKQG
ncbi:hypothetical protein SERLADRAFT_396841 [Serpula lacrymans var. lacrymans S7.9]|uniref:Uncharacterized protein n=1 Tax=Serpula lacrymans var. lacrymans (strain S7.9) TaxID=578457 RepID=F8P4Y4_SERL9|nr:uncharacterized protein SERLADRAFT_396841 [Serpula lacrymans var. lacrymans S7.9]EGO21671.1 hypothetical protein SERLADRAFT_396841 [Serpula lacrymans var. lacrymans S7.9]